MQAAQGGGERGGGGVAHASTATALESTHVTASGREEAARWRHRQSRRAPHSLSHPSRVPPAAGGGALGGRQRGRAAPGAPAPPPLLDELVAVSVAWGSCRWGESGRSRHPAGRQSQQRPRRRRVFGRDSPRAGACVRRRASVGLGDPRRRGRGAERPPPHAPHLGARAPTHLPSSTPPAPGEAVQRGIRSVSAGWLPRLGFGHSQWGALPGGEWWVE